MRPFNGVFPVFMNFRWPTPVLLLSSRSPANSLTSKSVARVLHARLIAPWGPVDGIPCLMLHLWMELSEGLSWVQRVLWDALPPNRITCCCWTAQRNLHLSAWQTNLFKYVLVFPSSLFICLNACWYFRVAVCLCLSCILHLCLGVCALWSNRTRVWQPLSRSYAA